RDSRLDRAQVAHHLLFEVTQDVRVAHGLDRTWRAADTGRVVDHNVDTAELARCRVDEVLDRVGVHAVTDDRDDLTARCVRELRGRLRQRSFGTGADGDVAALERQLAGNSPADAAAGAGDDGFLIGELQVHAFLLRKCTRDGYGTCHSAEVRSFALPLSLPPRRGEGLRPAPTQSPQPP